MKQLEKTACEAALVGGEILMKGFGRVTGVKEKRKFELVSDVDRRSEAAIRKFIQKRMPGSGFLGEENGESISSENGYRWIVDPLDGTTNFIRGFKQFCVSVGVEHEEKGIVAGAIFNPVSGEMFHATLGGGAYCGRKKLAVSKTRRIGLSVLTTGFAYSKGHELEDAMRIFLAFNEKCMAVRRPGSAALDLCNVASGVFDAFWERGLSAWDVAAGMLIVREAGGFVTDYDGRPMTDLFSRELVATNRTLHKTIIDTISASSG